MWLYLSQQQITLLHVFTQRWTKLTVRYIVWTKAKINILYILVIIIILVFVHTLIAGVTEMTLQTKML